MHRGTRRQAEEEIAVQRIVGKPGEGAEGVTGTELELSAQPVRREGQRAESTGYHLRLAARARGRRHVGQALGMPVCFRVFGKIRGFLLLDSRLEIEHPHPRRPLDLPPLPAQPLLRVGRIDDPEGGTGTQHRQQCHQELTTPGSFPAFPTNRNHRLGPRSRPSKTPSPGLTAGRQGPPADHRTVGVDHGGAVGMLAGPGQEELEKRRCQAFVERPCRVGVSSREGQDELGQRPFRRRHGLPGQRLQLVQQLFHPPAVEEVGVIGQVQA